MLKSQHLALAKHCCFSIALQLFYINIFFTSVFNSAD